MSSCWLAAVLSMVTVFWVNNMVVRCQKMTRSRLGEKDLVIDEIGGQLLALLLQKDQLAQEVISLFLITKSGCLLSFSRKTHQKNGLVTKKDKQINLEKPIAVLGHMLLLNQPPQCLLQGHDKRGNSESIFGSNKRIASYPNFLLELQVPRHEFHRILPQISRVLGQRALIILPFLVV